LNQEAKNLRILKRLSNELLEKNEDCYVEALVDGGNYPGRGTRRIQMNICTSSGRASSALPSSSFFVLDIIIICHFLKTF
jgi:hypothetical protein